MMKYFVCLCCFVLLISCSKNESTKQINKLEITLIASGPAYEGDFYSGFLPNTDYAIWIEDEDHNCIKTLQIVTTVVQVGEHGAHANHLPEWSKITGLSNDSLENVELTDNNVPLMLDAVTSASLNLNESNAIDTVSIIWDLTDVNDQTIEQGVYYYCAEVANISKYTNSANEIGVISEYTKGRVNLNEGTIEAAEATLNILRFSAE